LTDIDNIRIQLVKELIDLSPKVRAFVKVYLKVYYPKRK